MKRFSTFAIVAMVATAATAAPELKWNGDVQFRLREETNLYLDSANAYYPEKSYSEFSTKYMWNLKLGVKVNDNVSLKFRVSNPQGSALETVTSNGKFNAFDNNKFIAIPQAELQYKVGSFGLSAGIIEVKGNTALDLVRSSEDGGYMSNMDISNSWGTFTNNSQTGLKLSYGIAENVKVNMTGSVAEFSKTGADKVTKEVTSPAYADFRGILDVPVSFGEGGKFKVTSTVAFRSGINGEYENRGYSTNAGVDFSGKLSDMISLKVGAAYGQYSRGSVQPSGLLIMAKPTFKFGFNKVTVGYSFGQGKDMNLEGDAAYSKLFQHVDVKWGLDLAKGYTLMPRLRAWYNTDTKDGAESFVRIRPEIIFTAKF